MPSPRSSWCGSADTIARDREMVHWPEVGAIIASALLIVLWSGADWSGAGARSFSTAYTLSLIGGVGGTVTLLSATGCARRAGGSRAHDRAA